MAVQLALTGDIALPVPGWTGGGARAPMPAIAEGFVPPILRGSPIFSPERTARANEAATSPLGGAAVAGSISIRGRGFAVMQLPGGRIVHLPVGGSYAGMRLTALGPDNALFLAGGKRIAVPFGTTMTPPASIEAVPEEGQE